MNSIKKDGPLAGPRPRQQLVDPRRRPQVDEPGQDVGEIGLRIVVRMIVGPKPWLAVVAPARADSRCVKAVGGSAIRNSKSHVDTSNGRRFQTDPEEGDEPGQDVGEIGLRIVVRMIVGPKPWLAV